MLTRGYTGAWKVTMRVPLAMEWMAARMELVRTPTAGYEVLIGVVSVLGT